MLNPRPEPVEGAENLGGSTRAKGAVRRRLRMPMRLRVGERPAGAESGVDLEIAEVLSLGAGERAGRIGRRGETTGFRHEKSLGEGGAFVRKKLVGLLRVSLLVPSGFLERLGERKMMGSMFSVLSSSKVWALRLLGEVRVVGRAVGALLFIVVGEGTRNEGKLNYRCW